MKSCRHSGQVISNGDGLHPVKILDDLHAKSVKKFEGQHDEMALAIFTSVIELESYQLRLMVIYS